MTTCHRCKGGRQGPRVRSTLKLSVLTLKFPGAVVQRQGLLHLRSRRPKWVVSRQNEELGNALIGALLQGLDHKVVLGQGRRDTAGDKLGLDLGKPAANLGLPELGADVVDLVGDRTLVGNSG